jgi:restriction system protein
MAALSAYHAWRKGELLDSQTSIDSIRSLPWKDFELLVSEAYRRKGYSVEERGAGGPDGGVDLVLRKDNQMTYVQCKHWRNESVGVSIVRELYGVMAAERANRGIVVTSGGYTPDALDFARGNPLELIDGPRLVQLISDVQRKTSGLPGKSEDMQCPQCGSSMILRTAKHGHTIGKQFWGCTQYPQCRATRSIES